MYLIWLLPLNSFSLPAEKERCVQYKRQAYEGEPSCSNAEREVNVLSEIHWVVLAHCKLLF